MVLRNLLQLYNHLNVLAFQLLFFFLLKTRCMSLLIHTALVLLVNHLGTCIFLSLLSIQNLCDDRNRSYDGDCLSREVLLDYDYMY